MSYRAPLTGFEDLVVPATLVNPTGPVGAAAYNIDWMTVDFPNGSSTTADLVFQIPHSAKLGTSAVLHFHWQPSNTNAGVADFTVQHQWRNNTGEAAGVAVASWPSVAGTLTPGGVANVMTYGDLATLTKANGTISSILQVRVTRLGGTDAFTGDVRLVSADVHIEIDSNGSQSIMSK
jgi:hypothetical protein